MISVFREEFDSFQVGALIYDCSPLGEYHMEIPKGLMGNWRPSTNHSSWRRNECSGWNILVEGEKKRKVLEQSLLQEKGLPTITAGDED